MNTSESYKVAIANRKAAGASIVQARDAYRSKAITEAEYLAASTAYDAALAEYEYAHERWMEATAHLFASSPALYAALNGFVCEMDFRGDWDDGCFYYDGKSQPQLQSLIEASRAALSLARGETNAT